MYLGRGMASPSKTHLNVTFETMVGQVGRCNEAVLPICNQKLRVNRRLVIIRRRPGEDRGSRCPDAPGFKKSLPVCISMEHSGYNHAPFRGMRDSTNGLSGETSHVRVNRHRVTDDQKTQLAMVDDLSCDTASGAETWASVAGVRPRDFDKRLRGGKSRRCFR